MQADLLVDCENILGEGVQWNADQQRIWWTDIHDRALWSCDADGGAVEVIKTKQRLGQNLARKKDTRAFTQHTQHLHSTQQTKNAHPGQRCLLPRPGVELLFAT